MPTTRTINKPAHGDRVTLYRMQHMLILQPACMETLGQLRTVQHSMTSDHIAGCRLQVDPRAIYGPLAASDDSGDTSTAGEPVGMTLAGLEPVVRLLLEDRGCSVRGPAEVRQLSAPDLNAVRRHGVADEPVLDVVQHHDRGLIRFGRKADPAWVIGQIALAYPDIRMVIAATRKRDAGTIADLIRTWLPDDVTRVLADRVLSESRRIVVGTYQAVLGSCMDLDRREMVIAVDAVGMLGKRGVQVWNAAGEARLIGLLPDDRRLASRDADQIRGVFGFDEVHVPLHGQHWVPVDVVFEKVGGGPVIPENADTITVRRTGVWRNPVRNRRIASLVRSLVEGDVRTLQERCGRVYEALRKPQRLQVAVLVDNVEHGVTLARRLPGWPVVTGREICVKGLPRKDRDLLESVGTTSGVTHNGIYTVAAADQIDPRGLDVLVRADTGSGLPPIDEGKWMQENAKKSRLLLLDFDDRRHNELGRSTRKRRRAYRARGWYGPGADSVEERVRDFLASRPKV